MSPTGPERPAQALDLCRSRLTRAAAVALALVAAALASISHAQAPPGRWVATWSTALVGRPQTPPLPGPPGPAPFMISECRAPAPPPNAPPPVTPLPGQTFAPQPFTHFTNQTLRQIVRTSIGGGRVRIVLSNAFGTTPLTIGAAHVAVRDQGDAIQAAGSAPLTFSGRPSITIPSNAIVYSDPVAMAVAPVTDLAIDVYLPGTTNTPSPLTMHGAAYQTNYISETGNHAGKAKLPTVAATRNWFLLSRVEVEAPAGAGVIVAFGDSITDGAASTADTNRRWPDILASRLALSSATPIRFGVVNAGIGGNRVLSDAAYSSGMNALARFEIDALSQTGVTHVIVMEGINDIGNARSTPIPTAEDLIAAHKQLIDRARAKGVKVVGATLTPFWGAGYYSEVGEAKRQAVNEWIRTSGLYDGVADFDKATRDPNDPKKLLAAYDSCDHLHPNDAGFKAMAEAIDLALFRPAPPRPPAGPPDRSRPGPWDNDVIVHRVARDGSSEPLATFERAGVPTIARLADGRLIAAHQHFPEHNDADFDKVAARFSSDDGRTWTGAEVIQVSGLATDMRFPFDPTLVPLPDGRVRLYFTSVRRGPPGEHLPAIYSAVSRDGVSYRVEPGVRFAIEGRSVIDCAVALHRGVFHLFAPDNGPGLPPGTPRPPGQGAAPMSVSPPPPGTGYHATSADGLNFTRVADVSVAGRRRWLGNAQSDGATITFIGTGEPGIWTATSTDGIAWQLDPTPIRLPGADPGAVRLRDGGWIMVATGPPRRR